MRLRVPYCTTCFIKNKGLAHIWEGILILSNFQNHSADKCHLIYRTVCVCVYTWHVCIWSHGCLYVCNAWVLVWTADRTRGWHWLSSFTAFHPILWGRDLSVNLECTNFSQIHWPTSSRDPVGFPLPPALGLYPWTANSAFYIGAREQNSCLHVYSIGTLLTEPSPSPVFPYSSTHRP